MLIRPVETADIDALREIAVETGPGFTSLPDNRDFLADKIDHARQSLAGEAEDALYFFVLEDDQQPGERAERLAGCCAIEARVGLDAPFYHYRIGQLAHSSSRLGLHRTLDTLFLCSDHTGSAEVCSLYLREPWRGAAHRNSRNGTLLSRARWLFMAAFRSRFPERVLAEMRGRFDDDGKSPFWEALGQKFLPIEFQRADHLTGMGEKSFIGEMMPRHPICTSFLPQSARDCIGQVHHQTRPALAMLNRDGLRFEGYIDLFDGGPTVEAYIDDVHSIRHTRSARVRLDDSVERAARPAWLAATASSPTAFRAAWLGRGPEGDDIRLTPEEAQRLQVAEGDSLRLLET
ncbi:arginine N-succinyltransferase [Kushneria aurantia]|uniref:Arginine N-succinyltransferase n=1 Tax=Kushneria aurantia TaxID=504092 RepID=A0ABV6G7V2_9GAMM|nr:arginine N-succinyltransferase [Kushneria aurantia]